MAFCLFPFFLLRSSSSMLHSPCGLFCSVAYNMDAHHFAFESISASLLLSKRNESFLMPFQSIAVLMSVQNEF